MLKLGRCVKEAILIGKDIKVTILNVHGKKVTIGIEAPSEIKIYREELIDGK